MTPARALSTIRVCHAWRTVWEPGVLELPTGEHEEVLVLAGWLPCHCGRRPPTRHGSPRIWEACPDPAPAVPQGRQN